MSKATIYKHWSGDYEIALEAYGERVTDAVPVRFTGDVVNDLVDQVVRLTPFYASPPGRVVAQLLAAGVGVDRGAALVRERFFASRREQTLALIERGKARGQLRPALDAELVNDVLFGAIVSRLFNDGVQVTGAQAAAIAHMALQGIAVPRP